MISAFWMILILCGMAGVCVAFSSRRSEEYFAFSICVIIAVLYVFAIAGVPEWGYQVVRAFGLLCFLASVWLCAVRKDVRQRVLTPGCLVFVCWILIAWWAHRGQVYNTYDDFNHWGTAVNRLYALGVLPSAAEGVLHFSSYPPGSTLFCCFWTWLGGNFSEGNTISAANVFLLSCLMPLLKNIRWKQWKQLFPLALSIVFLPMIFKQTVYQDLYVDVLLGAMAAYLLITWFAGDKNLSGFIIIAMTVFALALVKASGIAIAVLTLAVITLDGWRSTKQERRTLWLTLSVAGFCAVIASLSWRCFLSAHAVVSVRAFRHWEILSNLQSFLNGTAPNYLKNQYKNFFAHLTSANMMGGGHILELNYLEWLLVFALAACWLKRLGLKYQDSSLLRFGRAAWIMLAVVVVYTIVLYHTYTYAFEYSEVATLHSFDRYMSSIMMPTVCLLLAFALEAMRRYPPKLMPSAMIVLSCFVLLVSPVHFLNLTFTAPVEVATSQESRAQSAPPMFVAEVLAEGDRIAWLTTNTGRAPFDFLINRYEFMPAKLETPCWFWIEHSPEEICEKLMQSGCEYVYCFYVDEMFHQDYSMLFENPEEIADRTLYRIIRNENSLTLEKVI